MGTIFNPPSVGRTDELGNHEFIVKSRVGSKGYVHYTRRKNPFFTPPKLPVSPKIDSESYQNLVIELRRLRHAAKLTQVQLGTLINSNQAAISKFEQGKTNPSVSFLDNYALSLGRKLIINLIKTPN